MINIKQVQMSCRGSLIKRIKRIDCSTDQNSDGYCANHMKILSNVHFIFTNCAWLRLPLFPEMKLDSPILIRCTNYIGVDDFRYCKEHKNVGRIADDMDITLTNAQAIIESKDTVQTDVLEEAKTKLQIEEKFVIDNSKSSADHYRNTIRQAELVEEQAEQSKKINAVKQKLVKNPDYFLHRLQTIVQDHSELIDDIVKDINDEDDSYIIVKDGIYYTVDGRKFTLSIKEID